MRVIALLNQKGGTGKTTCTVNIGAGLALAGKKVLLVDMDPQAALTYSLGTKAHELNVAIYEMLKGEVPIEKVLLERRELYLFPANMALSGANVELATVAGREVLLKKALGLLRTVSNVNIDYTIIDCPPSLGLLSIMSLTAAKEIWIPLQMEYLALQGLSRLLKTVEVVKERLNPDLGITGIIGVRFDSRRNLNKEVLEKVREYFGKTVFKTVIRENIALAEAPSFGKTIFEYRSWSHGAEDYENLCREILKRG